MIIVSDSGPIISFASRKWKSSKFSSMIFSANRNQVGFFISAIVVVMANPIWWTDVRIWHGGGIQ